ncbi:Ig-like V-type domain-containing protein FAM187A [Pyxicephalus adspersus]|uniref:Ig-like domain-containing protein n=1 Tax=Pyxicephalus adspersus TaxID=30357 RepID=A0AAV3A478_PYXAD|nr:TPA: hypothetical protein GDO54_013353 [Pyxicephalus adspersus]
MDCGKLFCFLLFLTAISMVRSAEIREQEVKYNRDSCPAIPSFDSVAYGTDMNIELPCHCMTDVNTPVFWYYKKSASSTKIRLLTPTSKQGFQKTSHNLRSKISTTKRNVIIHKARVVDTGLYICGSSDGMFFWGYDVDVQDTTNAYVAFQSHHEHPLPHLITKHFTAFTAFWDWGTCDRCDVPGEQRSVGLCYVTSRYLDPRFKMTENGVASCGSDAVPKNFKGELSDRRPEIYIRNCQSPCHERKPGFIGTIKHWINKLGKLKEYIPFIPRAPTEKHSHMFGDSLTLACPGARPTDAVAWDKGKKRLYKSDYLIQEKKKRIYIDHGNNLNFQRVSFSDKATYYCWVQGKLRAGIKLTVQADPVEQRSFYDPGSIEAMKIIGSSLALFTIIFVAIHCLKCTTYNFRCLPCEPV